MAIASLSPRRSIHVWHSSIRAGRPRQTAFRASRRPAGESFRRSGMCEGLMKEALQFRHDLLQGLELVLTASRREGFPIRLSARVLNKPFNSPMISPSGSGVLRRRNVARRATTNASPKG